MPTSNQQRQMPRAPAPTPRQRPSAPVRRRRTLMVLVVVVVAVALATRNGHRQTTPTAPAKTTAAAAAALAPSSRQLGGGLFAPSTCVAMAPAGPDRHETVFVDAGHGGPDPGASGVTADGQPVNERDLTLPVVLDT